MEFCQIFVFAIVAICMTSGETCKDLPNPASITCNVYATNKKTPCKFPFRFGGRIFYGCTTQFDEDGKAWCSTATNETHHHIEGIEAWGYCEEEACPNDLNDHIGNENALKTEQLMEKYQCDEEKKGIAIKDCKCVDYTSCKSILDIVRQSKQLRHQTVIKEKLLAYHRERVCTGGEDDGLVHCCPQGRRDPPKPLPESEASALPQPPEWIDPRSIATNQVRYINIKSRCK